MLDSEYLMFGTDVVSCVYADQWNANPNTPDTITKFVDADTNAKRRVKTFRPDYSVLDWHEFFSDSKSSLSTIVYPKHLEGSLMDQLKQYRTKAQNLNAIALPTPPDYLIEWQPYQGRFAEAQQITDGYDQAEPTHHLIETSKKIASALGETQLTQAQARQVSIISALVQFHKREITVVDFGGAAGANFHILPAPLKKHIKAWCVVETPRVVSAATEAFAEIDKLKFFTSCSEIDGVIDYVLASSSFQYVEGYDIHMEELLALNPNSICIDRTPMSQNSEPKVYLQRVHRQQADFSYSTSYALEVRPQREYEQHLLRHRYAISHRIELPDEALRTSAGTESFHCVLAHRGLVSTAFGG